MRKREGFKRGKDTEDGRIQKREEYQRGKNTEEGRILKREEYGVRTILKRE
jgi:hypothetical protein